MSGLYLGLLLMALICMGLVDYRYKLALFVNWRATLLTVLIGVIIFLIWDIIGIANGIFFVGETSLLLPFRLTPELPLEELVFLTHLTYTTLVIYNGMEKLWRRMR